MPTREPYPLPPDPAGARLALNFTADEMAYVNAWHTAEGGGKPLDAYVKSLVMLLAMRHRKSRLLAGNDDMARTVIDTESTTAKTYEETTASEFESEKRRLRV